MVGNDLDQKSHKRLTSKQGVTIALVATLLFLLGCVLLFTLTQVAPTSTSTDPWAIPSLLLAISPIAMLTLVVAAVFMRDAGLLPKGIYTIIIIGGALVGVLVLIVGLVNTWDWIRVGYLTVGGAVLVRALLKDF
jgi:hypothetical protein